MLPGEVPYRVVDPEFVKDPTAPQGEAPADEAPPARPWFATLWGSIEAAGGAT